MNQLLNAWNEKEKQIYLAALSYVLTTGDTKSEQRREFMKNKAREVKIPLAQIKKVKTSEELIAMLGQIHNIKIKRNGSSLPGCLFLPICNFFKRAQA